MKNTIFNRAFSKPVVWASKTFLTDQLIKMWVSVDNEL